MTPEIEDESIQRPNRQRVLVIGLSPTVNQNVVDPLRQAGIDAHGSTEPDTADAVYDARSFDLIVFGRGALGPQTDHLKRAFHRRNPDIRFVDALGPIAVRQIIAALRRDPRSPEFVRDFKVKRDDGGWRVAATVLVPCRITLTLYSRPDGEALEQELLAEESAVAGSLDLHFGEERFSKAYSLVLSANNEEFHHVPFLGELSSPDDDGTIQNHPASAMRRASGVLIRDREAGAVIVSCWTLQSSEDQIAAARAALSAMPLAPGLLRFSVFRGLEDFTLLIFSQWVDDAARDAYITVSEGPRAVVDDALPRIHRDWREPAAPYRSFISSEDQQPGCLVIVRQPLKRPDHRVQRDWADTVIAALETDIEPEPGLCTATFFLAKDGGHVLNLAEWTSADAHRAALRRGNIGQHGSLGQSPQWQATRSHPGIRPDHDVRRYEFFGAIEPGGGHDRLSASSASSDGAN